MVRFTTEIYLLLFQSWAALNAEGIEDKGFVNDAPTDYSLPIIDMVNVPVSVPAQIRSTGRVGTCIDKGSFTFPGTYSYEKAHRTCMRRDGELYLYSYDLHCESGTYRKLYSDAYCFQDCTISDVATIAQDDIEEKYSGCYVDNIDISTDINVVKCMDETNVIESGIEILKKKRDIPHSLVNESVRFIDSDYTPYSNECYSASGKIISSSFTEEVMTNPNITTGSCDFTDMLNLPDKAKVYNWPRCFGQSCSLQTIRKLLSLSEYPSKWYCQRDIFLMTYNSNDYFPVPTAQNIDASENEDEVMAESMSMTNNTKNDVDGDKVKNEVRNNDVTALRISIISIAISIIVGSIITT